MNSDGKNVPSCFSTLAAAIAFFGILGTAGCGFVGSPGTGGSSGGGGGTLTNGANTLTASSTAVNFGNVTVGTSTAQLVTLKDTGRSNVTISKVTSTGSGFSASGGSNVVLTPNQSVTVSVNFDPKSPAGVQGTLSVSSDASNSLLQIKLSGTGVAPSGQHSVTLNWQPSPSQVIGYFIYRGFTQGSLSKLSNSVTPSTSYTDSSVAGGQTYLYAVTSVDSSYVESSPSNPVSVTIPIP